eukprot:GHVS01023903.1.p1 GENE.GHVS01023903.1~~GHVS01023903.1.p1  ORF type:complete len:111 (+),score=38.77 GHVS01023903.1:684-1016(+)
MLTEAVRLVVFRYSFSLKCTNNMFLLCAYFFMFIVMYACLCVSCLTCVFVLYVAAVVVHTANIYTVTPQQQHHNNNNTTTTNTTTTTFISLSIGSSSFIYTTMLMVVCVL